MASQYYYLKGKTKWFRSTKVNEYGKWEHVLYPDGPSLELIRKLQESTPERQGIKNVIQPDKDGDGEYLRIGRLSQKTIRGKVVAFPPPEVLDKDGVTPLRHTLVGNGSDVTTKVEYYTYEIPPRKSGKRGSAIRWESTRVDNLIPFELKRDFDEKEQHQVKGLAEQPPQEATYF
jgi:hypothetical protein